MHREHIIQVEGHRLQALEYNADLDSIPLIFIHGITASNSMWHAGQTPLVKEKYHWFALSLPGHFPAFLPHNHRPYEINAEANARILGKAIHQLVGNRPVIIVGHSTGGFATLNLAANASEWVDVAGLISIAGFSDGHWIGVMGMLQWLAGSSGAAGRALFHLAIRALGSNYRLFKTSISLYAHDKKAFYAHPKAEVTFANLYTNIKQISAEAMMQYFQRMPHIDITPDVERITVPALIMAGDHDPIVAPSQSRLMAERIPNATLHMIPGVGHLPMSESGDLYNQIITDWLTEHAPHTRDTV